MRLARGLGATVDSVPKGEPNFEFERLEIMRSSHIWAIPFLVIYTDLRDYKIWIKLTDWLHTLMPEVE